MNLIAKFNGYKLSSDIDSYQPKRRQYYIYIWKW